MRLITYCFLALFLIACKKDDDTMSSSPDPDTNALDGTWSMTKVDALSTSEFEKDKVLFIFDTATNMLKVTNSVNEQFSLLESGTYAYTLEGSKISFRYKEADLAFAYNIMASTLILELDLVPILTTDNVTLTLIR